MNEIASEPDPLDQLAESFLTRFRAGERPPLTEYTEKHPELAEEIRELFPALVAMEKARPNLGSTTKDECAQIPSQLGDYRIVREIGRGGMGVVYEAIQESLHRHVALKVLPFHSWVQPKHLERFEREARAAARLHHTNIVPVFGVGQSEGIHYYAMQFIHGQSLDAVLQEVKRLRRQQVSDKTADSKATHSLAVSVAGSLLAGQFPANQPPVEEPALPSPSPSLSLDPTGCPQAGKGEREGEREGEGEGERQSPSGQLSPVVAGSPDPATSSGSGVPSPASQSDLTTLINSQYYRSVAQIGLQVAEALEYAHSQGVLHRDVKPSNLLLDTAGRAWITDFGLAKTDDSHELTNPGDMVGTLRYMAPERLQGRADPRSDVYGLGITLYESVTLRPAFEDSSRADLIERISAGGPRLPRRIDAQIPRDLETMVLKAMAKEPGLRYRTAGELAEDLRRFLADRPIKARRSSLMERTWRWCRRNPAVAGLLAALFLLLAGGLAAALVSAAAAKATRRETAEGVIKGLDEARRLQQQGRWPEAVEAAQRAEALLQLGGGSAELAERVQRAVTDLQMIKRLENVRLDHTAMMDDDFDHVLADSLYADAFRDYGIDAETLATAAAVARIRTSSICPELLLALDDWIYTRKILRNDGEAGWEPLLEVARAADPDSWRNRFRDALDRSPGNLKALKDLASAPEAVSQSGRTLGVLGDYLARLGAVDEALSVLRQAQQRHPEDFWINLYLGHTLSFRLKPARPEEGAGFFRVALALRPPSPGVHVNLGQALFVQHRYAEAEAAWREAIRLKPDYAMAHNNLGVLLVETGRAAEATSEYRKALDAKPCFPCCLTNLANLLESQGAYDQAIAANKEAIRLQPDFAMAIGNLAWQLATCPDPRLRDLPQAVELGKRAVGLGPNEWGNWSSLGMVYYRARDWKAAMAASTKSMELHKGGNSYEWFVLAMAHWQLDNRQEARRWYDQAVQWMEKNQPKNDDFRRLRAEAAELLGVKGQKK